MKRQAVAYHEAGHAVAGFVAQQRIKKATIRPGTHRHIDYLGIVQSSKGMGRALEYDITPARQRRVENAVIGLYAGVIAERQYDGKRHNWQGSESDRTNALSLISYLTSGPDEERLYLRLLWLRAQKLVELWWAEIEAVARALLEREELSGDDIREVVQASFKARR